MCLCKYSIDLLTAGGTGENIENRIERKNKMDIKEQVTKAVEKITKDKKLQEQFKTEPVKALESALGIDLPDEIVDQVIKGVKAKLTADTVSGAVDSLKGLLK